MGWRRFGERGNRLVTRTLMADDFYLPNKWLPFGAAMAVHVMLFVWNPTLLSGGSYHVAPEVLQVQFMEKLPVMAPQPVKPVPKPVEKKPVIKKAHKAGISVSRHQAPITITRHHVQPQHAAPARKPFVSKITMPKFVPHESDEPIAASPAPGISAPAPRPMTQAFAPAPKLKSKTRGVRAQDINFEISDRGGLAASDHVVAIPVGEESGDQAVLPSAAVLHSAPTGAKTVPGFRFTPGLGTGSGELAGKNKGGYHGVIRDEAYVEGTLEGGTGNGKGKVSAGPGFEIGGPVGDRKIVKRRLPEYPEWAEEKGISALVKIYFTVKPDGTIRTSMRILRSSGYTELDTLAKEALMNWRFTPTTANSDADEAWGVITFRFTLA